MHVLIPKMHVCFSFINIRQFLENLILARCRVTKELDTIEGQVDSCLWLTQQNCLQKATEPGTFLTVEARRR